MSEKNKQISPSLGDIGASSGFSEVTKNAKMFRAFADIYIVIPVLYYNNNDLKESELLL